MRAILYLMLILPMAVMAQETKHLTKNMKQLFSDGFAEKSLSHFSFCDSSQWVITKNGQSGKDLKCLGGKPSDERAYKPIEMGLIGNVVVADFVLEFDFLQRGKDFSLRDLCVVYGYADSTSYCFAQAASEVDRYVHNVFAVDGSARPKKIGVAHTQGVVWGYEKWHKITVVRQNELKAVQLYVDGELVVETSNDLCRSGLVGIGTFGSEFKIDNIVLWGVPAQ